MDQYGSQISIWKSMHSTFYQLQINAWISNQTFCQRNWVLIVEHSLMKDEIGGDKERSECVSWQPENEIGSDKQGSAVRPTCNTKASDMLIEHGGWDNCTCMSYFREAKYALFLHSEVLGAQNSGKFNFLSQILHSQHTLNPLGYSWVKWMCPVLKLIQRILWGWQIWRCVGGLMTAGNWVQCSGSYNL